MTAYDDAFLALDPAVYWRDGSVSPVVDEGSLGADLTITGATLGVASVIGGSVAMTFDGVNDHADATVDLSGTTDVTFVYGRVRLSAYGNADKLLLEFNGKWFEHDGSAIVDPDNGNGGGEADTISIGFAVDSLVRGTILRSLLPAGEDHYLAIELRQTGVGVINVYVDGEPVDVTMVESGAQTWTGFVSATLGLMYRAADGSLFRAGTFERLGIIKGVLSPEQHASLYAASLPAAPLFTAHHSGGSGNTAGAASLGGGEGGTLAGSENALLGAVADSDRVAGLVDYRCLYVHNAGTATATDVKAWVETPSAATDVTEAIAADTSNPAQTIANATTAPVGVSFSAPSDYAGGIALGDLEPGEKVPLWVKRTVSAAAAGGTDSFTLGVDSAEGNEADFGLSYLVVAAVEIFVDADNASASDAWTRVQATDPDTPFRTLQAAARVAQPGDTITIKPATAADASNVDPRMYVGLRHRFQGGEALPYGDNTGNDPITVRGDTDGDTVITSSWGLKGLRGWIVEDLQIGYDIDSDHDFLTMGDWRQCGELTHRRCGFTGGGADVRWTTGAVRFEGGFCRSPFSPAQGSGGLFLDGVGFHFAHIDNNDLGAGESSGQIYFSQDFLFTKVQGEDCCQVYLGTADLGTGDDPSFTCEATFVDILQAQFAGAPHTDCVQILGGHLFTISNAVFYNCDSAIIASDYHNEEIRIENTLIVGGNVPVQIQGTDLIVIRQCTILRAFSGIGVNLFFRGNAGDVTSTVVMVNNVMDGYQRTSDFPYDADASIFAPNLFLGAPGVGEITGLPEFGTSDRMAPLAELDTVAPLPANYELANTPILSPGIAAGVVLDDSNGGALASDRLGRAWANPPDVGCHQSDPGTLVTPAARAPYIVSRSPAPAETGVDAGTNVAVVLLPKPGEEIAPGTVSTSTAFVFGSNGVHLPAVVTLDAMDGAGQQRITIDVKQSVSPEREGDLFDLASYTARLSGIEDTEGSVLPQTSWSFSIDGPDGAEVVGADDAPDTNASFTMGGVPWSVGATVKVYPAAAFPTGSTGSTGPSGPQVTSAVVSGSSSVTFTGLTEGIRYVAFAEGRAVGFMVPSPVFRTVRVQ